MTEFSPTLHFTNMLLSSTLNHIHIKQYLTRGQTQLHCQLNKFSDSCYQCSVVSHAISAGNWEVITAFIISACIAYCLSTQQMNFQQQHFLFYIIVASQRTPTISYISQEQIKDIGGTVELECSVQYAEEYPVLWMRIDRSRQSDGLPISTGSALIIRDSRFSLRYDTASSTYTLQVRGLFSAFIC